LDQIMMLFFCDGVSACIPILKLCGAKILFYCHFPDQLLTRKASILRKFYRLPWNLLERVTTEMADKVMVNSNFTKNVYLKTFGSRITPEIVYPCINIQVFDKLLNSPSKVKLLSNKTIFLSLNRFDPSKNIELAIDAFALLCTRNSEKLQNLQLVVAGGYDPNVQQNVVYLKKLQEQATKHNLSQYLFTSGKQITTWNASSIVFITDISEENKVQLLKSSLALLYTPSNEHFGIVPVEAMASQCPVIAVASGGLLETVTKEEKVGFLSNSDPNEFADSMETLLHNPQVNQPFPYF